MFSIVAGVVYGVVKQNSINAIGHTVIDFVKQVVCGELEFFIF